MRRGLRKLGFGLSVAVIVSPAILVFFWMLSLSLKNEVDNTAFPPVFIPNPPTLANFVDVFEKRASVPQSARVRRVRVVRDYGMFDRREAPQYYRDVQPR